MKLIFDLNIAEIVNSAIIDAGGLLPGILTHFTIGARNPNDPSSGINPVETTHIFQGFVDQKEVKEDGRIMANFYPEVSILGASISPLIIPKVNDSVKLEGIIYTLLELTTRDPASAIYIFRAER